ncbi:hypothetical protein HBH71_121140 [Parastagonospora nodorum]|nr:hypothetical protein HBH71_121140 [Parastagonospora nodorum]
MSSPDIPPRRPRLPDGIQHYSSKLDHEKGPLRTTTDGDLKEDGTGDWLVLDTPPHDMEDRKALRKSDKKVTNSPVIGLPEAKNGATGLDDPRARKPIMRYLRNKFYGFDRAPVAKGENPDVVARRELRSRLTDIRGRNAVEADMMVLGKIREQYPLQLCQSFGGDWLEHSMEDEKFWRSVLDKVLELGTE